MRIDFTYPNTLHPSGTDLTVLELARILEDEYGLIKAFCQDIDKEFSMWLKDHFDKRGYIRVSSAESKLQQMWRDYARSGRLNEGISLAAQGRGDPPFVDTGTYFMSLRPKLVYNKEEKEKYRLRD